MRKTRVVWAGTTALRHVATEPGRWVDQPEPWDDVRRPGTCQDCRAARSGLHVSALAAIIALTFGLASASDGDTDDDASLRERAAALHREAVVVDGHNDLFSILVPDLGFDIGMDGDEESDRSGWLFWKFRWLPGRPKAEHLQTQTDLARAAEGGLDGQFFSVWASPEYYDPENPVPGRATARAHAIIDLFEEQAGRHADRMAIARTAADVHRIAAEGKLAALLGIEGGHAIEDNLENLRDFYTRGVRYMTLTWSFTHTWADSAGESLEVPPPRHGGLSPFGREVVHEMNNLGMLVDISHSSDETFWDTLEVARAPVIASHSCARALVDHPRNLSDDMLRAIAANGGVVMINFFSGYIDARKTGTWPLVRSLFWNPQESHTTVAHVVDHIEHVIRVAGIDHVGLGSDFDGTAPTFFPENVREVSDLPEVTLELVRCGHPDADIRKILGGNVLRALAEAEGHATSAAGERR